MKVLEYGCGYSTIWWAKRVSSVVSVERSTHWLEEVRQALSKHSLANVQLLPFQRFSGNTEEDILAGQDIAGLAPIIRDYATLGNAEPESYDVVVIDDIFRNETASAGVALVKPGGLLILDDSERERYQPTVNLLRELGWSFSSFYGVSPYHFHEKQTTIWHKPIYSQ
jgi:predicted O-methyltransferase YrrM